YVCPTVNRLECTTDWSKGYMVYYHPSSSEPDIEILRYESNNPYTNIQTLQAVTLQFSGDGRCLNRTTFHIYGEKIAKIVLYDSG
ncbi:MAG TPA: hypothetical protein PLD88_04155, partial [Candidatus Berkiella sp.]|nr:hypothetical protein [Candidatus Berkiella sp.]